LKSTTAYYLLLLYITVSVKPLLPIVSDWYQHEFNKIEHLACVHIVYGSHHLQHEIAENSSDTDHNKNQNNSKSDDQISFHIIVAQYKNEHNPVPSGIQFKTPKILKLSSAVILVDGPPPKFG